jgi:ABC-type nitrate/sulfonate/bicarbonate transport system substrate-binding protein
LEPGGSTQTATYSVAQQLGFFTENGLDVVYNQVSNSTAAFQSILGGQYDILTATVDNALNLRFNFNKPVTVLGQLDQGPDLVLASIPSITSVNQLQGKPIIVDSPVSGYAYLLRAVLSSHGLELENGDYFFMVSCYIFGKHVIARRCWMANQT